MATVFKTSLLVIWKDTLYFNHFIMQKKNRNYPWSYDIREEKVIMEHGDGAW
jgi:hypothetical protein